MKQCSVCEQTLPLEAFDKQSTGRQGCRADCKECRKRFARSREGLIKQIYATQKSKSKKRGHAAPAYTQEQLLKEMLSSPLFDQLYKDWEASGYLSGLRPSVDRKDDTQPYKAGNLQLMTWQQNNDKGHDSAKAGVFDSTKPVDMLTLDGVYVRTFHSVSEAARHFSGIPSNIVGAINHRVTTRTEKNGTTRQSVVTKAYGHKWRYAQ